MNCTHKCVFLAGPMDHESHSALGFLLSLVSAEYCIKSTLSLSGHSRTLIKDNLNNQEKVVLKGVGGLQWGVHFHENANRTVHTTAMLKKTTGLS